MAINTDLSIITLKVNGLNAPIKRQRVADWIKKQEPTICCLQETHLRTMDPYKPKLRTRNQPQEKKWENTDYTEAKQHVLKKPMGQWGNQEGN